ncbi:MBOAT, membrane-bound o-acyltransferase family protein [Hirsutella rhossiliensis]|uniref:MBOAT, membrane-bound o-acyltransferase family domain-containing protein n=1 Tax=Hirsutella rhossiliensis TaxID=111463 RepID=A0A9P8N4G3_9HYPO|nr:MBOAT, membrane-bound o-acyltransferase family domain-containing protein [Hirsutella rhossiliensis]KAH0967453.1 MBOAT, membrane-bound o-acyltransferase family domain-containing protein [Hirsutella rhossiliensis]
MTAERLTPEPRSPNTPRPGPEAENGGLRDRRPSPPTRSLASALREAGVTLNASQPGSETPSEEDYDENVRPAYATGAHLLHDRQQSPRARHGLSLAAADQPSSPTHHVRAAVVRDSAGVHILPANERDIQDLLRKSSQRAKDPQAARSRGRFSGLVFTQQFSAFDPQNVAAANSPFHGFYVLFWLAVALFVFKISADNWRQHGTPLGSSDIMKTMFRRDVVVLLVSDGIMCALTGVSWVIQKFVFYGYLHWDSGGWIIQNIWQTAFIAGVVSWTLVRGWPWTHTVFFVLHGLVMLMKQHSYAFYNGYLSTVHDRRLFLLSQLKRLDLVDPASNPSATAPSASAVDTSHLDEAPSSAAAQQRRRRRLSASQPQQQQHEAYEADIDQIAQAVASRQPLDDERIRLFGRAIRREVDALADELRGTAADALRAYPNNLGFVSHYRWIPLPTVVYELEYPQSESISWAYVAEKVVAMVGIIFVMIQVSQYSIYPVVMKTVEMKEAGVPLSGRVREFPWLLSDLIFPFMIEYLLVWYLIWETILNILAELTYFADRSFYGPWWNSVSWDQFARDWNRPVHIFLLRHVYHSSISSMKVNKHAATLITFFFSACVHELIMLCLFRKLRGYLLILQMCQLPLVRLSRTKWLKGRKTLGNFMFWLGIFTCPSLLCSLYLVL